METPSSTAPAPWMSVRRSESQRIGLLAGPGRAPARGHGFESCQLHPSSLAAGSRSVDPPHSAREARA
jgi:hypothetical protein